MSFWTYLGQIINFLAFVVILRFLLYKPVRRLMQQRREEMESQLHAAEKKLKDAETLRAETEQRARELDEKRDSILKQAREQAEAQRKELLEQAETLARERLERFRRIMEQERSDVLGKITGELRDTILEVAAAALGDASHVLTGRALEQVETLLLEMPDRELDTARKALNDLENRVQVRSAKPLTDDEARRLKSASFVPFVVHF
jgi:F-type H+-transporting ATPase subunit b